jgi:hypothetical protein
MEEQYQLPREFGTKWVEALRSGKYKQTTGKLHKQKTMQYCCLGVACRVAKIPIRIIDNHHNTLLANPIFKNFSTIPDTLKNNKDLNFILANKNDNGKSFAEIADWIEKHVEFI